MRAELTKIRRKLETLEQFAERHDVGASEMTCVHSVGTEEGAPSVCFYDKASAGKRFGVSGWKRVKVSDVYYDYRKEVDGVLVSIYHAETIPVNPTELPVDEESFAEEVHS